MNLDTIVSRGHAPWLPNDSATDVDVWQADDVPVLGTFRMADHTVLFATVMGVDDGPYTSWGYVPLRPDEAAAMEDIEFEDLDDMWMAVAKLFDGRNVVFADATGLKLDGLQSEVWSDQGMFRSLIKHLQWAATYYRGQADTLLRRQAAGPSRDMVSAASLIALLDFDRVDHAEEQIGSAERLLASRF